MYRNIGGFNKSMCPFVECSHRTKPINQIDIAVSINSVIFGKYLIFIPDNETNTQPVYIKYYLITESDWLSLICTILRTMNYITFIFHAIINFFMTNSNLITCHIGIPSI